VAHWKHKIEISVGENPDLSEVARELAAKLRELPAKFRDLEDGTTTLDDIIPWLDEVAEHGKPITHESVDDILRELYSWGDANGLWVHLI
jgi:hypothetical protein